MSLKPRLSNNALSIIGLFLFSFLLALISGTTFFSISDGSADNQGVGFSATVESIIGLSTNAVSGELVLDITPAPTGSLASQSLVATVSTNNSTGYKLQINSLTNNTDLVNVLDPNQPNTSPNPTTPLVPTLPVITSTNAPFGAPATLSANTWGYSSTPPPTTTFIRIPPLSTPDTLKNTLVPDVASTTTLTFGTNLDSSLPSGDYTGTIVLTATGNPIPDTIRITKVSPSINWSGGDIYLTGINFPTTTTGTTITIGGTPCASTRLIDTSNAICVLPNKPTGSVYPVVITSTALGQSNTNRTVAYDGANYGNMQDFSQTTCDNMPMGLAQIYTDARNNNVYRVKKMLDNKCWMIDNLAYPGEDPAKPGFNNDGSPSNNTYGDTHILTFSTACGANNYNTAAVTNCAATSAWAGLINVVTPSFKPFTTNNNSGNNQLDRVGNIIPSTAASLENTYGGTLCASSLTGSGNMSSVCISYLYHWCSAVGLDDSTTPTCDAVSNLSTNANNTSPNSTTNIAMTGVVGKPGGKGGESRGNPTGVGNQAGVNSTTAGTICPAGWRLPVGRVGNSDTTTSNLNNEWNILNESMYSRTPFTNTSSTTINAGTGYYQNWHPSGSFSGVNSGVFSTTDGLTYQSTNGNYWSSSLLSSLTPARMTLTSLGVNPGTTDYNTKNSGLAVRCVL